MADLHSIAYKCSATQLSKSNISATTHVLKQLQERGRVVRVRSFVSPIRFCSNSRVETHDAYVGWCCFTSLAKRQLPFSSPSITTTSTFGNRLNISMPSVAEYAVMTLCFADSRSSLRVDSPCAGSASTIRNESLWPLFPITREMQKAFFRSTAKSSDPVESRRSQWLRLQGSPFSP